MPKYTKKHLEAVRKELQAIEIALDSRPITSCENINVCESVGPCLECVYYHEGKYCYSGGSSICGPPCDVSTRKLLLRLQKHLLSQLDKNGYEYREVE